MNRLLSVVDVSVFDTTPECAHIHVVYTCVWAIVSGFRVPSLYSQLDNCVARLPDSLLSVSITPCFNGLLQERTIFECCECRCYHLRFEEGVDDLSRSAFIQIWGKYKRENLIVNTQSEIIV